MKGSDLEQIHAVILSAFDRSEFEQIMQFRFDIDVENEVGNVGMSVLVDRILRKAIREGWEAFLIAEVALRRPLRVDVQEIYRKYARHLIDETRQRAIDQNIQATYKRLRPSLEMEPTDDRQKEFNTILRRAMQASLLPPTSPQEPDKGVTKPDNQSEARARLQARGVPFTSDSLFVQIRSGNADEVRWLLEAGLVANVEVDGKTPLDVALEAVPVNQPSNSELFRRSTAVLRALLEAPEPPSKLGVLAHGLLERDERALFLTLTGAGLPLDISGPTGVPLFVAISRKDERLLEQWHSRRSSEYSPDVSTAPTQQPKLLTESVLQTLTRIPRRAGAWLLLWAARNELSGVVDRVLSLGCSVDERLDEALPSFPLQERELKLFWPGGTALHWAAARGNLGMVKRLIRSGAALPAQDREGCTPLHRAAALREDPGRRILILARRAEKPFEEAGEMTRDEKAFQVVTYLLKERAPPDQPNARGETALEFAVDFLDLVNLLLEAGAKANLDRALHLAVHRHAAEVIPLLVRAGADVNAVDEEGWTPLNWLCWFWDKGFKELGDRCNECLRRLLESGADVRLRDSEERTALHHAARLDLVGVAGELLNRGADPNSQDRRGFSPLMGAQSREMAEVLLSRKADPGLRDGRSFTAVDHATIYQRAPVAQLLRDAPYQFRPKPEADLLLACFRGEEDGVRAAVQAGASPNVLSPHGQLPLAVSVKGLREKVVATLLQLGADPNARQGNGWTALGEVFDGDSSLWEAKDADAKDRIEGILRLLLKYDAQKENVDGRGSHALFFGFWWWYRDELCSELLWPCDPQAVNWEGKTLLTVAVQRGKARHVKLLLSRGADVDARDHSGQTALFWAVAFSEPSLVSEAQAKARLLLVYGADVNLADSKQTTPLITAVQLRAAAMTHFLLENRADPNHKDARGLTARDWALRNGDVDLFNSLLVVNKRP
jgi:ankyrin repeat protein